MRKYWIISILMLIADRATKMWASQRLVQGAIDVWPGVVRFRYARNTGAAFSLFDGNSAALAVVTLVMIAVVLAIYFREKSLGSLARGGLALIASGGAGNLFDRLLRGYVVDFIQPIFVDFAIFNIADVAVCAGAALVAIGAFKMGAGKNAVDG